MRGTTLIYRKHGLGGITGAFPALPTRSPSAKQLQSEFSERIFSGFQPGPPLFGSCANSDIVSFIAINVQYIL